MPMTRSQVFALIVALIGLLSGITIGILAVVSSAPYEQKALLCSLAALILALSGPCARYALR